MGKKAEKPGKGATPHSATSRGGDESSTPEPYTCSGNFSDDFIELWLRSGLEKDCTPVIRPRTKWPEAHTADEAKLDEEAMKMDDPTTYILVPNSTTFRPSIQVEFEVEDTKQMQINHAKEMFIRSWKLQESVVGVLKSCILDHLQTLNLWNVGLRETTLKSLASFFPSVPCLKTLVLDGNPIPSSEPYYFVLAEDSQLQHLCLRNNQITDIGATLIGKSLQNKKTTIPLTTLNLSCNLIGDAGASELAKGLRMNRVLLSLSLSTNKISDEGCKAFSSVLQRICLEHDEIVQRRKLISQQGFMGRGSSAAGSRRADSKDRPNSNRSISHMASKGNRGSSKKRSDNKKADAADKAPKKEDRGKKGVSVTNETPSKTQKGKKSGGAKDGGRRVTTLSTSLDADVGDIPEIVHPLLDSHAEHVDGKVFISGCMTLVHLNLSRNKIGNPGLECLWKAIQYQIRKNTTTAPGLLKLNIHKNLFSSAHPTYIKIQETMLTRDPGYKPDINSPDEDVQSVMS
ncbi:leucine-rich repeat-containing protein 71-like isoform X2 [Clavelina lepadiformis]|uniref:Leucine-rich repeat-containing protein 71 n=1 Tax=Clavelina lepadiformis TaxID=159417 RepID=A0ABP0GD60_CLALP